jgi:hypothetical protein
MKFIIEDDYNFRVYNRLEQEVFHYQYNPELKLSLQIWKNYIIEEDVIAIYKYIAQFAFQHKHLIIGSLSDLLTIEGSFHGSSEWLMKEYMPLSVKYGLRFTATVRPNEFFAQLAMDEIIIMAKELGYTAQYFDNYAEAQQWITQKLQEHLGIES